MVPSAVRPGGLEAESLILARDVAGGDVIAAGAGVAAFEEVVGEEGDMAFTRSALNSGAADCCAGALPATSAAAATPAKKLNRIAVPLLPERGDGFSSRGGGGNDRYC